jgi:hypothetical protein
MNFSRLLIESVDLSSKCIKTAKFAVDGHLEQLAIGSVSIRHSMARC